MYRIAGEFFSGSFEPFWPHSALLTTAIVASFAVAAGIVLENPKFSLANVLVVGGVAVEAACTLLLFGFDEGISGRQQSTIDAQQKTIISLEKKLAPRVLSDDQQAALIEAIKSFAPQPYMLSVAVGSEALVFACVIDKNLKAAGWIRQEPTDFLKTEPCNSNGLVAGEAAGVNLLSDIHVRINGDDRGAALAAAALASALNMDEGIVAFAEFDKVHIKDAKIVVVMIGAKL